MRFSSKVAALALPAIIVALLPAVAAQSAGTTPMCQGQRATIVGHPADVRLRGTAGDDVIVTRGAAAVVAGRGSDRICVTGDNRRRGGTQVDAGPGDDRVRVATTSTHRVQAFLGAGADVYRGGSGRDVVSAEYDRTFIDPAAVDVVDRISTGAGADQVRVGVGVGHVTHDVLDLGAGDDTLVVEGLSSPDVRPEGGAGADRLQLRDMPPCWADPSVPGCTDPPDWSIDNALEVGTVDGVVQSRWTDFEVFSLADLTAGSVTFTGSDADETLIPRILAGAAMGPGDDSLVLSSTPDQLEQALSGGPGSDTIGVYGRQVTIDLAAGETWEQDPLAEPRDHAQIEEFENASGRGEYSIEVLGDDGDNDLHAYGCSTTVTGGGGDDVLTTVPDSRLDDCDYFQPFVTFDGGPGADVLRGGRGPDHLDGGDGNDTAYGSKGTDVCLAEVRHSCED